MTCSKGPPWLPGKTAEFNNVLIFFTSPFLVVYPQGLSKSLPKRITPPRGPRKVLCVVVVTICAYFNGLFNIPADRKSTRLNSSHANISYAVFCLKKKKKYK